MIISRKALHGVLPLGASLVALLLVGACSARGPALGARFVKAGEPTISYDAPDERDRSGAKSKAPDAAALQKGGRTGVTLGTTLESTDRVLAAALLTAAIAPSAESHILVGQAYTRVGITDHAYAHFEKALKFDRCSSRALEGIARLWRDWNIPQMAVGHAHRAVHCAPQSASAHNTLGTVFVALGLWDEATRSFESALRLEPAAAYALNNLCYASLHGGALSSAIDECKRALDMDGSLGAASNNLALGYALSGDFSGAEAHLLTAGDRAAAMYQMGVLHFALGQFTEAALAFDQAIAATPGFRDAALRARKARSRAVRKDS